MTTSPQSLDTADPNRHFRTDHLMGDLKGRSVRGGAVTMAAQACKFILQMGSTMVLARLLTPADFGLIAMVSAFTGFVGLFKDLGLSTATVQRAEINHAQVSTLFWINVALSIALTGVGCALAPAVAWFYGEPELTLITIAISATFVFGGLSAQHTALLRRQMRFKALAVIQVLGMACGVAAAVALAWYDFGYWALVALIAGQALAIAILSWSASGWWPGLPRSDPHTKEMVFFGGNLTGFNLVNYLSRNADNILIGWWIGAASLGLYTKAYALLMLPIRQINGPISSVTTPTLSRLQDDPDRYRRAFLQLQRYTTLATVPLVTFLILTADWIVLLFLGDQWTGAIPVFMWLGAASFAQVIMHSWGPVLISQGRTREMFYRGIVGSSITVASFAIGLRWGVEGVAAAYAISAIAVQTPLTLWWVGRSGPVKAIDYIRATWPCFCASLGITATILPLRTIYSTLSPVPGILTSSILLFAVYSLMMWIDPSLRDLPRRLRMK